ncbi:MAG: NAD(P)/FAD-dependent oxidoreductase [Candidatus Lokiarchaeota archaeon]|nr:NAD(P)/FAD-dependent oxidoreductase [Candidatus Lokiarchaeota archaeon]
MFKITVNFDYIVIGGGIAGLHIGALLNQHGKVVVLEKTNEIGGRAKVVEKDGFKLDFGAHPIRFGPKSDLGESLEEIGKPIEFIKPGKVLAFLDDGSITTYPSGGIIAVLKSKLVPFFKTLKLMIMIKKMAEQEFIALYDMSLEEWFNMENIIPKIREFLTMASATLQVNPFIERSSAGETLQNIRKVLDIGSVYYPRGGWNEIFSRFSEKIKENGEIRLKSEIAEIIVKEGKAIGVKIGNNIIKGDKIISTIPVQQLFTILDENLCDKDYINKCKNLRPTAGVSIDFCLSKPISDIDGGIMLENPLGFGFIPSNISPEVAPEGKSLMTFFTITNVEDIKDKNKSNEIYQHLRSAILRFFPEIENNLEFERPLFHDMIDGVEVNIEQHRLKRPGNEIKEISNLFITGDSVGGEGAGGDIGHTSVRNCYEIIIGK